jgi:DNA polymerase-3 subunit alpha
MENFLKYLDDNLMSYDVISDFIVEIDGKTFELYKPAFDGALFDDDFNFVGVPADDARKGNSEGSVETDCDYYAFSFGGVYYMLPKGSENSVKLIRLKYLGQANQEFPIQVFLGVHGQYELTSGSGTYSDWCKKAKFLGIHTLGICEKNTLAGALKFQEECQKNGLKSVIGMECTVLDEKNDYRFTVKVYVRNEIGWRDLLTINKFINCDNPKYIGLDDFRKITDGNENLILFLDPKTTDYDKLKGLKIDAALYQLDPCEYVDNERDKNYLLNLRKFFNDSELIPVAAVDAWYLDEEYSCIRPRLHSIGGTTAYESNNQYFKTNDQYFMELAAMFPDSDAGVEKAYNRFEEAVQLLNDLADAMDFTIDVKKRHLPRYKMTPEESAQFETNEDLFWHLIDLGLERHPELLDEWGEEAIAERIDREVGVIKLGEAIDYFLITWDIINWCHRNGIMTGISRGSAGGCLVSFLLGITKLDPMRYNLLFERFLNAGRVKVSLPDIDCDYPGEDRPRVKKYMEERYGWNQVCSVGTYSALQLRAAIKDMSRLYGLEFQEVNEMMKVFDVKDRKPEDLFKIACAHSRVKKFVLDHPDLINEVMLIMPAPKAQSIHACAMMVFPDEYDMFRWVPIRKQGDEYVTEWEGGEMDAAGFLKEDVLGVKQFDKFQDMVRLVKEHEGTDLDIFSVPLDDPEVYRYFQNGWNEDNFHFGSSGLTGYCKQMKPENIEDLIAAISLYRPGAMENGFHNEYIARKEGRSKVEYFVGTEEILKNTYGVFCYQEQIMELCKKLGGLSLVEADDVRKAMVKKKYEALQQYQERFIPYYRDNFNVTQKYSEEVWEAIDKASTYLFNRSHAAAYAITGYISQWVKVHYPIEYWSVAFKYAEDKDYPQYIAEINKTGVCTVRPVDINISDTDVIINFKEKALYWSITGVKQVAEKAATQILKERQENGQYYSLQDFISRNRWKGSAVNSRIIQNLILTGAFDALENITSPKERVDLLVQFLGTEKKQIKDDDPILRGADNHVNDSWWWSLLQKKLSGLAFFDYKSIYEKYGRGQFYDLYEYCPLEECLDPDNRPNNGYVIVAGYVSEMEVKKTRKGESFCRLVLESNYEFIEIVVFQTEYAQLENLLQSAKYNLIIINGTLSWDKRREQNIIRVSFETNIVTLTL